MKKLYFLSLLSSSLATRGTFNDQETTPGSYCLKCEYINIADTEALAVSALGTSTNPCIAGQNTVSIVVTNGVSAEPGYAVEAIANNNCVAEFFIFKDKQQDKFIYGVKRTTSTTAKTESRIDFPLYKNVKAYTVSSQAENPVFIAWTSGNKYMDGRADPSTTPTTAVTVQEVEHLGCILCHEVQKFEGSDEPDKNDAITMPCWNPSLNGAAFDTTDFGNTPGYCNPVGTGICKTETYGWKTVEDGETTVSNVFVGIRRGCASLTDIATDSLQNLSPVPDRKEVTQGLLRLYAATDDASKAIELTKAPVQNTAADAVRFSSSSRATTVENAQTYEMRPITNAHVSSSDDSLTDPDVLYQAASITEIECIKCETSAITNTDIKEACYAATATTKTRCDSLSCFSASVAYKSETNPDTVYYYAKRGCTVNPELAIPASGPVTDVKVQPGFADIRQKFEKTTTDNGNTGKPSTAQEVKAFTCYECSLSTTKEAASEPTEDELLGAEDTQTCWNPESDTTPKSATCLGQCYTKAFSYKQSIGTNESPNFSFHLVLERGCDADNTMKEGNEISGVLNGVKRYITTCDANDGEDCNKDLITSQKTFQTPSILKCQVCKSAAGNSKKSDSCFAERKSSDAKDCPDATYTHCLSIFSVYKIGIAEVYNMERKCHKGALGEKFNPVATVQNVNSTSEYCSSASCNGKSGVVPAKLPSAQQVTEAPPSSAVGIMANAILIGLGPLFFILF